jgi:hypothetical protein
MSKDFRLDPKTSDKKKITRASAYTLGTRLFMASRGDHRTNGRGKGARFELSRDTSGESNWLEVQFNDWIEMGGGELVFKNAEFGDWVCMRLFAPATTLTSTPGTGNCVVSDGVIVPYSNGTHTVDLETADDAIPLLDPNGFWQWSYPDEGCGTFEARPDQNGNCHLLSVQKEVHTYVHEVGMLGANGTLSFSYPGIDPTRIPPQWKIATRIHHAGGSNTLQVSWIIVCARINGFIDHA